MTKFKFLLAAIVFMALAPTVAHADDIVSEVSLELQGICAKQALWQFKNEGWEKETTAGYINHYNSNFNRCFMLIEHTSVFDAGSTNSTIWTYKTLEDAFEGKIYGSYSWHTVANKKYWEVPPFECTVTLLTGEVKLCQSSEEFDQLANFYMQ